MPRLLITGYCTLPGPGRSGVQLRHVIRALSRRHSVEVLVRRGSDQAYVERSGRARILRVPVSDSDERASVEAFRRAVRRQLEGADYDVIHIRDGWSGIPVLEKREEGGYAVVYDAARSPLAGANTEHAELAKEMLQAEEICLREADMVLAPTEAARRFLCSLVPEERVHLAPPGVDVDAFDWERPVASNVVTILYVGRVGDGLGIENAVRALAKLLAHCNARLVLAGEYRPDFQLQLLALCRELGVLERVELLGAVDHHEVSELIASSTICLAAEAEELSPRPTVLYPTKILEYLACRRPVVAPRRGSVAMILRDRQHALLFNPEDPDDLAAQCLRLLSEPDLAAKFAFAGYELVRREHTASATRRSIREAYAWLASVPRWAEQLTRPDDELLPDAEVMPLSNSALTNSAAFANTPSGQEGTDSFTQEVYDGEDNAPDSDHTMVTSYSGHTQVDGRTRIDEWVVEDAVTRASDEDEFDYPSPTGIIESRFVAGEIGAAPEAAVDESGDDEEDDFTAVSPPLGGGNSGESTS